MKIERERGMADDGKRRQGGCDCGAVRYQVDRDPIFVNNCYCALCQQQSGSTSAVYAFFEAEALRHLSGELVRHSVRTGSDRRQQVLHCASCGVGMWLHSSRAGRHGVSVRLGTLDDAWDIVPDAAVFVSERMPWVTLPAGIPAFDAYYTASELLPPARYARLRAVLDAHLADQSQEA